MALVTQALRSEDSVDLKTNQLQIISTEHTTASFATGTGTLPAGTPLAYAAGQYKKFVLADVSVAALVWPNDVVLDDTNNAVGEIMLKGEVRKFTEIEALVEFADRAALKASCKDELVAKGIIVRGIANINQ